MINHIYAWTIIVRIGNPSLGTICTICMENNLVNKDWLPSLHTIRMYTGEKNEICLFGIKWGYMYSDIINLV